MEEQQQRWRQRQLVARRRQASDKKMEMTLVILAAAVALLGSLGRVSAWAPLRMPPMVARPALRPLPTTTTTTVQHLQQPHSRRFRSRGPAPLRALSLATAVSTATSAAIPFPATLATGAGALAAGLQASPWWTWTMLLLASTAGVAAERTRLGAALSSPLITMGVALILCNCGLLPAVAPAYTAVNKFLVPLAIPLLLLDADLQKVLTQTGRLLRSFAVGSLGTVIGTVLAALLVPLDLGGEGWTIAAALASRHIGGAVNFVAVTETLGTAAELTAAGIAADNLVVALYFGVLFALGRDLPPEEQEEEQQAPGGAPPQGEPWRPAMQPSKVIGGPPDSPALGYLKALSISSALCLLGTWASATLFRGAISSLPVISLLAVTAATLFPRPLSRVTEPAGHIAVVLMNLFFSVTGAQGKLGRVLATAPRLFLFSALQLAIHLAFLLGVGRGLLRLPLKELLVASNANVGGPTTAAAMAGSKRWKSLVLPGILTGIFGYATATFLGLALGRQMLLPIMARAAATAAATGAP